MGQCSGADKEVQTMQTRNSENVVNCSSYRFMAWGVQLTVFVTKKLLISFKNIFQGRRTSERFIKPAIPLSSLNSSAPNVLTGSGCNVIHSFSQNNNSNGGNNSGSNVSLASSLNNSLSSSSTSSNNSTVPSQSSNNIQQFMQPASPMDTEFAKD